MNKVIIDNKKKMTARMIELADDFKEADLVVEDYLNVNGATKEVLEKKIAFVKDACGIEIEDRREGGLSGVQLLLDDYTALIAVVIDRKWR
jgi:hypothetical protein